MNHCPLRSLKRNSGNGGRVFLVVASVFVLMLLPGCNLGSAENASNAQAFVEVELGKWIGGESNLAKERSMSLGALFLNRPIAYQVLSVVEAKTKALKAGTIELVDSTKGVDKIYRLNVELNFRDRNSGIIRRSVEYLVTWQSDKKDWTFCLRTE